MRHRERMRKLIECNALLNDITCVLKLIAVPIPNRDFWSKEPLTCTVYFCVVRILSPDSWHVWEMSHRSQDDWHERDSIFYLSTTTSGQNTVSTLPMINWNFTQRHKPLQLKIASDRLMDTLYKSYNLRHRVSVKRAPRSTECNEWKLKKKENSLLKIHLLAINIISQKSSQD